MSTPENISFQERANRASQRISQILKEEQIDLIPRLYPENWFSKLFKRIIKIKISLGFRDIAPLPQEETAPNKQPTDTEDAQTE